MENQHKQEASEFLFSLFVLMTISYSTMIAFFYINGSIELIFTALSALLVILVGVAIEERFLSRALVAIVRKIKR